MFVALVTDRTGRYAHVCGVAPNWTQFTDQLEDIGCEVIENQTEDWEGSTPEEIAEDCVPVHRLFSDTDFLPH